jgi:glutamate synthase domain-containing protein 1
LVASSTDFQREGRVMCGIVGFLDKTGGQGAASGRITLTMLEALARRGPDGSGVAMIGPGPATGASTAWSIRIAGADEPPGEGLAPLGRVIPLADGSCRDRKRQSLRFRFAPNPGVIPDEIERALGARRGGLEVLSLGRRLDLVKQVGSPSQLEAAYGVSNWTGPLAIGHTRLSTESRIDLSHSQPFWVHGIPDLATVHNGHVTNYHQLRRRYEQRGVIFYTDNDSEVIGVYLRDRMEHGQSLPDALEDSVVELDGAFNFLVASSQGLGIVRDRYGFKPLVLAETDLWIAVATEEIALRLALGGDFTAVEPPPASASFYPTPSGASSPIDLDHSMTSARALAPIED